MTQQAEDPGLVDPEQELEIDPDAPDEGQTEPEEEGGAVVVGFGDEEAPTSEIDDIEKAPEWVRDLRKNQKELRRENEELRSKLSTPSQAAGVEEPGAKPTLESCGWDADKLEAQLDAWHEKKRAATEAKSKREDAEKKQRESWEATQRAYEKAKTALKVPNFDISEDRVKESLSQVQQAILLKATRSADSAAQMVAALGSNPKKLKEVAAITDPVEFAGAIGELKAMLKVTPRRTAPIPETPLRGSSARPTGTVDAKLAKLLKEAQETGNMGPYRAYKRTLKERAK